MSEYQKQFIFRSICFHAEPASSFPWSEVVIASAAVAGVFILVVAAVIVIFCLRRRANQIER